MKEFLQSELFAFILIGIGIVAVAVLWLGFRGKYRDKAKQMLLSLVIAAEQKFGGGGTGPFKFSYVAERLYSVMPIFLQLFFSAETIGGWIEDAVTDMKKLLASDEK